MLQKIVIAVLSLPFLLIAGGFLLPADTTVERSTKIGLCATDVYSVVSDFNSFNFWSPWASKDPAMQVVVSGEKGSVGHRYEWQSKVPEVGNGSQQIVNLVVGERIDIDLSFEKQNPAKVYFLFKPIDANTSEIVWGFSQNHGSNPVNRYMGLLFDGWLGADYETGLSNLKIYLEQKDFYMCSIEAMS